MIALDGAAAALASTPSASSASQTPVAEGGGSRKPLELLHFRITSGIENKNPKDTLTSAVPGQRVWTHLTIRNRSAETRSVKVAFRVNGDERTAVTLDIDPSWSFRTWGYNTLRDFDTGELSIEVTDDTGATMVSGKLPIRRAREASSHPWHGDCQGYLDSTPVPRRKPMQTTTESQGLLHCSFCRKDQNHVAKLVAGPAVYICDACVTLCTRVMTGKPTAAFAGWASLTDDEFLATLPAAAAALDAADGKLREHVDMLRERISWERIAAALGVTRQAAWARFSEES